MPTPIEGVVSLGVEQEEELILYIEGEQELTVGIVLDGELSTGQDLNGTAAFGIVGGGTITVGGKAQIGGTVRFGVEGSGSVSTTAPTPIPTPIAGNIDMTLYMQGTLSEELDVPPVEEAAIIFADLTGRVYKVADPGLNLQGHWVSPTLNRENPLAKYTIQRLTVFYRAREESSFDLYASGDGGETWSNPVHITVPSTEGGVKVVSAGFNVTGHDVRFKVGLPMEEGTNIRILRFSANLVERTSFLD